mmetsp:Transcript_54361/g.61514  ORF Transcript_54361/g.61514 Transcript_54361/m.61514 type:complete len:96 (+) Transcript_54361:247-534(+)
MLNGYVTGLSLVNIGGWVYPMVIINISCIGSSRLTALSLFPIPSSIVQVFSLLFCEYVYNMIYAEENMIVDYNEDRKERKKNDRIRKQILINTIM